MSYFRERNDLKTEYSGYGEASKELRNKLYRICNKYASSYIGVGNEGWFIPINTLNHEIGVYLNSGDILSIIIRDDYSEVFEAIEIFLDVAKEICHRQRYEEILMDVYKAFQTSGSVYQVSNNNRIELKIDEKLAKSINEVGEILKEKPSAYNIFFQTINEFLARKSKTEDIVKNIFVAFEDYLKFVTKLKDYSQAINKLKDDGIISSTQKALLDKIYAYRSDTYAISHAGNAEEPDAIDGLWFLDTVVAQIKLINNKLKRSKK